MSGNLKRIIGRLLALSLLLVGLTYVSFYPVAEEAFAARCCQTCPGGYPPDAEYCVNHCPSSTMSDTGDDGIDWACVDACEDAVAACYATCTVCHGGGGGGPTTGGSCYIDAHCPGGWRCINGTCYLGSRECYGTGVDPSSAGCNGPYPNCWMGQCF